MEAAASPLVVLVHGAWHGGWCFAALQAELDSRGIPSLAIDLPGHGASTEPFTDLAGDAAAVAATLAMSSRPIVLVGHSYGGAVIGETVAPNGNVVHQVYLAAYVLDVGETVIGLTRAMPETAGPNALVAAMSIADGASLIDPALAHDAFYGHCDPMVGAANAARLCPQPLATMAQEATVASWRNLPTTYVRCTDDRAVALSHQDVMAARCTNIETLETDHSPFASMPIETAEIIARIVRDA
ncbi:MAG: putative esterase [Ilumatobacteraceae bacterium]|nr:putative esterase [Ilumatobacteraceae bacterium]